MINVTSGQLVFNATGRRLNELVRDALDKAASTIAQMYGMGHIDLETVTTKTHKRLGYVKYIRLCTLSKRGAKFDQAYVQLAFDAYTRPHLDLDEEHFYRLTLAEPHGPYPYRKDHAETVQVGLGFLLIALHSNGAVTLPYSFNWPFPKQSDKTRIEFAHLIGSELIQLVRSVGDKDSPNASALDAVTTHVRRQTWFLSNGTKLLLATGWNKPEDVNIEDLLAIKDANDRTDFTRCGRSNGFRALVDVLERRYGDRVSISVRAWDEAMRSKERLLDGTARLLKAQPSLEETVEAFDLRPSDALPERLSRVSALPGLALDFQALSKTWLTIEIAYLRKLRRETTKEHFRAIGHWNLYLFFYLPYWFDQHSDTPLKFPRTPSDLVASVFVSSLVPLGHEVPLTFIEFIEKYALQRQWGNENLYMQLKNLEQFFAFIERHKSEIEGCQDFAQPLSKLDMPTVSRSAGTNKRPIPRRIFAFYVAYVETLVTYAQVVLNRILAGDIAGEALEDFVPQRRVIDTMKVADVVGFVPTVFFRGKLLRLNFIPNCLDLDTFKLKDGRTLRIPQPHSLHHVLVAIYTGIRNNHIQWLDARTFDSKVHPDEIEFTKLWVNTDKVKKKGWEAHVNMRVVEVLRMQARWRELIDCDAFSHEVHYQRNPKTKWPPILPLFANQVDGHPHPDKRYATTWNFILMGVQGIVRELDVGSVPTLCELLPLDVPYDAPDKTARLNRYRDSTDAFVALEPKGDITPHSARVGVVSHLINVLPADIIGKYVTGQHESVVYHYVHLDEDEMVAAQQRQAVDLQVRAYGKDLADLTANGPVRANPRFVKADGVNSRFSQALKQDLDETLASYGCVSLTLNEGGRTGIDVLKETRGAHAAFNKTELCPFGNICPPDVLKQLRGIGRCAMCPYAVRSVDHLPAVQARARQTKEHLESTEAKLDAGDVGERYTDAEQQQLEAERQRLADEVVAWKLVSEVLEVQRRRIELGQDTRRWVVPKPEVIEKALRRLPAPSNEAAYVLARLGESVAYPMYDSPEVRARFDLLRRQLLANVGNVREALTSPTPPDVASQCVGLLKAVVEAHGLTYDRVVTLLSSNGHLDTLPAPQATLLLEEA